MTSDLTLTRIAQLPADFGELVELSLRERFAAIQRMQAEFERGKNRFDQPGEIILEARVASHLIGICGLNRDPYAQDPRIGRVRHLYVHPDFRRSGVGRALVSEIIAHAKLHFARLRLRTMSADADRFYLSLGFAECLAMNPQRTNWR